MFWGWNGIESKFLEIEQGCILYEYYIMQLVRYDNVQYIRHKIRLFIIRIVTHSKIATNEGSKGLVKCEESSAIPCDSLVGLDKQLGAYGTYLD